MPGTYYSLIVSEFASTEFQHISKQTHEQTSENVLGSTRLWLRADGSGLMAQGWFTIVQINALLSSISGVLSLECIFSALFCYLSKKFKQDFHVY